MPITATYQSSDGYRQRKQFKTPKGALKFIERWIGNSERPGEWEVSVMNNYAVSYDGIGVVYVHGISILELRGENE